MWLPVCAPMNSRVQGPFAYCFPHSMIDATDGFRSARGGGEGSPMPIARSWATSVRCQAFTIGSAAGQAFSRSGRSRTCLVSMCYSGFSLTARAPDGSSSGCVGWCQAWRGGNRKENDQATGPPAILGMSLGRSPPELHGGAARDDEKPLAWYRGRSLRLTVRFEPGIGVSAVLQGGMQMFAAYDTIHGFRNLTDQLFTIRCPSGILIPPGVGWREG